MPLTTNQSKQNQVLVLRTEVAYCGKRSTGHSRSRHSTRAHQQVVEALVEDLCHALEVAMANVFFQEQISFVPELMLWGSPLLYVLSHHTVNNESLDNPWQHDLPHYS